MHSDQEMAAAETMQRAAGEIVAILTERMHSLGATRDMVSEVSGTLISAAWMMQKLWEGEGARPAFVALLRGTAENIEGRV